MRPKHIYVLDCFIILFCIAGFYHVSEKAGVPVVFTNNSLVVEHVRCQTSAFTVGDKLLAIDGTQVLSIDEVEFILDTRSAGQSVTVSIEHNGIRVDKTETLERFFSTRYMVIQGLATAVFIFLGMFVYTKRKQDAAAQIFNWVTLSSALIIATTWGNVTVLPYGLGLLVRCVFNTAYAVAGVLFIHFTLIFPSVSYARTVRALRFLYAAAIGLAISSSYFFLRAVRGPDVEWFRLYNQAFNNTRLFLVVCILAGIVIAVSTYILAKDESEKRKLRWILLGLAIGPLSFITFWVLPNIFTSRGLVAEEYILLTMLSVPVTFAISIVRHRALNIDQIFERGTVYAIVLYLVLMMYILIVGLAPLVTGLFTITSPLAVSTIAAVVIAAFLQTIREKTQSFVDKQFFNVRYNYRDAEKLLQEKIMFCYDEHLLAETFVAATDAVIPSVSTSVFFLAGVGKVPDERIISLLRAHASPISVAECIELGAQYVDAAGSGAFNGSTTAIAVRIHSETNGLLGGVLLGPKRSGFRYTLEDIDLLRSFCHHAAAAADRIMLQRALIDEQIERSKLKELSDLKSYFVSSVTHELKSPLVSIKLYADLIQKIPTMTRETREEYANIVKSETDRLMRLIDNVLDLAKIEKGIKEYHLGPVELNECVVAAMNTLRFQLQLHEFSVETKLSPGKMWIRADKDAVHEVLINLVNNAIKYSSKQKFISVSTQEDDRGFRMEVEDHGNGIARADLEKIFEPFERTDSTSIKHIAGTGLGLALVKHISTAHDAVLDVESEQGKGSTFSVTFPPLTLDGEL